MLGRETQKTLLQTKQKSMECRKKKTQAKERRPGHVIKNSTKFLLFEGLFKNIFKLLGLRHMQLSARAAGGKNPSIFLFYTPSFFFSTLHRYLFCLQSVFWVSRPNIICVIGYDFGCDFGCDRGKGFLGESCLCICRVCELPLYYRFGSHNGQGGARI